MDNTPPTPVCDEITQVTLDPEMCWAQVAAEDLNDGSNDNCCDKLYYAVAKMEDVQAYEESFATFLADLTHRLFGYPYTLDELNRQVRDVQSQLFEFGIGAGIEALVIRAFVDYVNIMHEIWINACAFDVVEDFTGCDPEMVVTRVYEACHVPPYDPHIEREFICVLPSLIYSDEIAVEDEVFTWTMKREQDFMMYNLLNACWDEYFPVLGCFTNESLVLRSAWCIVEYAKGNGMVVPISDALEAEFLADLENLFNEDFEQCLADGGIRDFIGGLAW